MPAAAERAGIQTHDVNLIGEWNVGGEFWNVAPLFDELGLRILCTLSGDSRFREVQTMHRAEANMVVCSKAMLSVARRLGEDHGTPFFEGSFYGVADTSKAFRDFAGLLNDARLSAHVEAMIAREEAAVHAALDPLRARLRGKRVLIFTGGYKSWSIVSAMQDLGMTVVATGTEKSTEEDRARIRDLMGADAKMIDDNDQVALLRTFEDTNADILIAGDRYIYPTLKSRIPFLDIDHVRSIGYAGLCRDDRTGPPVGSLRRKSRLGQRRPRRALGGAAACQYRRRIMTMAEVLLPTKALTVNPLKVGQPIGASLAFLGLARCMPLEHGARGCTSFNKLFFMRHFREPIALQTTAMDMVTTVIGADDNVVEACGPSPIATDPIWSA